MSRTIVSKKIGGTLLASLFVALPLTVTGSGPAAADFRLCNNTSSRVGVAVGYKDADGWTTEGWANLRNGAQRQSCRPFLLCLRNRLRSGRRMDGPSLYVYP